MDAWQWVVALCLTDSLLSISLYLLTFTLSVSFIYIKGEQIHIRENQRCRCHSRLQRTAGKRGLDGIEIEEALLQRSSSKFWIASSFLDDTGDIWVLGFDFEGRRGFWFSGRRWLHERIWKESGRHRVFLGEKKGFF